MKKILIINSSAREENSQSRLLTQLFIENWSKNYPQDVFLHRDVGLEPIPHITDAWIKAVFTKAEDRSPESQKLLELSDILIKELKESDVYVIGVPMYNWSIPSSLKAYIDHIMRINETWTLTPEETSGNFNYVGLLKNKKLFILSSRGDNGYGEGERNANMNFQTAYLKTIFNIIGVQDIEIISLDNEEYGGELFAKSQQEIYNQIQKIK